MLGDIIQPTHLLFILVVALLVLGPKRLPEVGRSLGRGLRDFRQGMQGVESEARSMFHEGSDEADSLSTQPVTDNHEAPTAATPTGVATASASPAASRLTITATRADLPGPGSRVAVEPEPEDYAD